MVADPARRAHPGSDLGVCRRCRDRPRRLWFRRGQLAALGPGMPPRDAPAAAVSRSGSSSNPCSWWTGR